MIRRKHEEESHNHERWVISYADFITLLFAFFVVMYSISSVNDGKYKVLSDSLENVFSEKAKTLLPIQVHGLSYGLFASLIAPFGGFFASAIKRAYDLKDFESMLPGHGGMMDRMDCHLFMMAFTSFHYKYVILSAVPSLQKMIHLASMMTLDEQIRLAQELGKIVASTPH